MTALDLTIAIEAPAERVWSALADFGGIAAWSPNVKTSRLTSSDTAGTGTSRECTLAPMGTVQERVTEWAENRLITIEIYEFKNMPGMRSANVTLELVERGTATEVAAHFDYEVGFGPLGAGMNTLALRRMFIKALSGLLAGLKHFVETGRPAGESDSLDLDAVVAG